MHTDLTHRFEFLDKYWQRWQERDSFKVWEEAVCFFVRNKAELA